MEEETTGWDDGETRLDRVLETVVSGRGPWSARGRSWCCSRTGASWSWRPRRATSRWTKGRPASGGRIRVAACDVRGRSRAHGPDQRPPGDVAGRAGHLANAALLVPLSYRGRGIGVLAAFDRTGDGPEFGAEDESLLMGFAASAAMALAAAQSMAEARLRESIASRNESALGGRASSTTRPFRAWGRCACACPSASASTPTRWARRWRPRCP